MTVDVSNILISMFDVRNATVAVINFQTTHVTINSCSSITCAKCVSLFDWMSYVQVLHVIRGYPCLIGCRMFKYCMWYVCILVWLDVVFSSIACDTFVYLFDWMSYLVLCCLWLTANRSGVELEASETSLVSSSNYAYTSFPVDVVVYVRIQPSLVRFTCLPVSRVECLLRLPSVDVVFSTKKADVEASALAADTSPSNVKTKPSKSSVHSFVESPQSSFYCRSKREWTFGSATGGRFPILPEDEHGLIWSLSPDNSMVGVDWPTI